MPCSFRGNGNDEIIVLVKVIDNLIHNTMGTASVDGNSTQPFHKATEWLFKDGKFPQPMKLDPQEEHHCQQIDQIPVAGVRGTD
jgi:hypothetical protein